MNTKTILTPNFEVALLEFQEAIQDGWELSTINAPHAFLQYEIHLVKHTGLNDVASMLQELVVDNAQAPVKRVGRPTKQ